ncbi:MAG: HupE/UreJ family protein [Gammaproteobacteria bacterium]|uniref:HupE/UreJ family protein n=1 Tax=Pseudomaricurvus alcaniphilus TaxID=1166482 RepID=UPI001408137A|nr:HupE/UreJ family protein [Pseudomaricurvus alcaniphilus]MBR9910798.1 HupE/UreJ family protein [Gammaproteobacteria bacterium]NHN37324.1 HupE/UreJ family protein [Pseudomaricurvus alcaniphilus]
MPIPPALGHSASTAYVTAAADGRAASLRLDLSVTDSASLVPMDINRDRQITWGELLDAQPALAAVLASNLQLSRGGKGCTYMSESLAMTEHNGEPYVRFNLAYACAARGALSLDYRLLFARDASHRALAQIRADGDTTAALLSPTHNHLNNHLNTAGNSAANGRSTLVNFWREGVAHILAGYDHLLFLLTLLLPCVLLRTKGGRWQPSPGIAPAVRQIVAVVTAFTLGHSITLALVILGYIPQPGPWIETAIALSIVLAALNNLTPLLPQPGWLLAAALGLLHGFGFAGALRDIGLEGGQLLLPLLGFNLGVESGQLLVVAIVLPLLLGLRRYPFYRTGVVAGGSCCAAVLGAIWMLQTLGILGPLAP